MNAMIIHAPAVIEPRSLPSGFWQNSLAAGVALALHVVVLTLLVHEWAIEPPPASVPSVLKTQLVMLQPVPAPALAPAIPEPVAAMTAPAPVPEAAVAAPVKPAIDPQVQAQKLEHAALARKRVEEKKREVQAEQQRQRQDSEKRAHEAEQQQLARQQAQQAERARQTAEQARQPAAAAAPIASSRQYLPVSKEAPDYPQRALDKNLEGDCTVEYTVNTQGKIENPQVLDGCHPLFIRPSLAAANTFRYQPKIVEGQVVSVPAVRNTFHYRIK